LEKAFHAQREFLILATKSKKPDQAMLQQLLKPLSEVLMKISELRDRNRTSSLFNHLSTVSEGVPALGWLAVVS
jgi:adenylyl cyclase-associated protein